MNWCRASIEMIEVASGLWVGSQADFEALPEDHSLAIVHACKEPHHRAALGYRICDQCSRHSALALGGR